MSCQFSPSTVPPGCPAPSGSALVWCLAVQRILLYLRFCLMKLLSLFVGYFNFWLFLFLKLHKYAFLHLLQSADTAALLWLHAGSFSVVARWSLWRQWDWGKVYFIWQTLSHLLLPRVRQESHWAITAQHCCVSWHVPAACHPSWLFHLGPWSCLHLWHCLKHLMFLYADFQRSNCRVTPWIL